MANITQMLKELLQQKERLGNELKAIEEAITALSAVSLGKPRRGRPGKRGRPPKKRVVSEKTRQKIIAAQRRRRRREKERKQKRLLKTEKSGTRKEAESKGE